MMFVPAINDARCAKEGEGRGEWGSMRIWRFEGKVFLIGNL